MLCSILFSTERIKGDEKVELQQRRTIVTGALLLSNIMAGMDGTIVNTALPAITSDLHGLQYMGWIIATFLLGDRKSVVEGKRVDLGWRRISK